MRPQPVVMAVLQTALPGLSVASYAPSVDHRTYPLVLVQRAGGVRNESIPHLFSLPEVDVTVVTDDYPESAEQLYDDVLDALFRAARRQGPGGLHSVTEVAGPSPIESPFPDTFAVVGSLRVGIRTR